MSQKVKNYDYLRGDQLKKKKNIKVLDLSSFNKSANDQTPKNAALFKGDTGLQKENFSLNFSL